MGARLKDAVVHRPAEQRKPHQDPIAEHKMTEYRKLLTSRDSRCQEYEAVMRLQRAPEELVYVTKLLSDPEKVVRLSASWAIGELASAGENTYRALSSLGSALHDEDPDVRMNAIFAIMYTQQNKLRVTSVVDNVRAALFDSDEEIALEATNILWNEAMCGGEKASAQLLGIILRSLAAGSVGQTEESWLSDRSVGVLFEYIKHSGGNGN